MHILSEYWTSQCSESAMCALFSQFSQFLRTHAGLLEASLGTTITQQVTMNTPRPWPISEQPEITCHEIQTSYSFHFIASDTIANGTQTAWNRSSENYNSGRISFQVETCSSVVIWLHRALCNDDIVGKDQKARVEFCWHAFQIVMQQKSTEIITNYAGRLHRAMCAIQRRQHWLLVAL